MWYYTFYLSIFLSFFLFPSSLSKDSGDLFLFVSLPFFTPTPLVGIGLNCLLNSCLAMAYLAGWLSVA